MHILYVGSSGGSYSLHLGRCITAAGQRFSFLNYSPDFFEPLPGVLPLCEGRYRNLRTGAGQRLSEEAGPWRRRAARLLSRVGIRLDHAAERRVRAWLDEINPDVVYSQWGTVALPTVRLLMKVRPDLPVVHEFLSYPTDWFGAAERVNEHYREVIENLAGRIYCSPRMQAYVSGRFSGARSVELVRHSKYSRTCWPGRRLTRPGRSAAEPHVVCLATFDYQRRGGDVNDIGPRLLRVAETGVHVHALQPPAAAPSHPRLHWFPRLAGEDGTLAEFCSQFDACLVLYNLADPKLDRTQFVNSLPERFLFALVPGIPIVLPAGELDSCEQIVKENQIGFAYADEEELRRRLSDEPAMAALRARAERYSAEQTLEADMPALLEFLEGAVKNHARSRR